MSTEETVSNKNGTISASCCNLSNINILKDSIRLSMPIGRQDLLISSFYHLPSTISRTAHSSHH